MSSLSLRGVLTLCLLQLSACKALLDAEGYEVVVEGASGSTGCGAGYAPDPQIVKSCVLRISCVPGPSPWTISSCLSNHLQVSYPGAECTTGANSCADITECLHTGFVGQECLGVQDYRLSCNGNKLVECVPGEPQGGHFFECANSGASECRDNLGCVVLNSCSELDTAWHCDGTKLYKCVEGVGIGQDCGAIHALCSTKGTCYYGGSGTCSGEVNPCEGDVRQVCSAGTLYRYSCEAVGLRCEAEAGEGTCVAPGCTVGRARACKESCDSSDPHLASFCVGGLQLVVDCTAFGFQSCAVRGEGAAAQVVCEP